MCHRGFGSGPCPCTHPRSRSQGELVEVLLKVVGGILSELCIHPDARLHRRALVKPRWTLVRRMPRDVYSCRFR